MVWYFLYVSSLLNVPFPFEHIQAERGEIQNYGRSW